MTYITKVNPKKSLFKEYFKNKNISDTYFLGTWKFGGFNFGKYDQLDALETLDYAYNNKIRTYDIASFYAKGNSNKVLKKFLSNKNRKDFVLCAKVGLHWKGNQSYHDASDTAIKKQFQDLLNTFNTSYVDILLLHWPDPRTSLEASLNTLNELKQKHKCKFIGVCNIDESHTNIIEKASLDTIHMPNNILRNKSQKQFIESLHAKYNLCLFSLFENGFLTSTKYQHSENFGKKDHRRKLIKHIPEQTKKEIITIFEKENKSFSTIQCIYIWSLENLLFDSIIIGPKNINQIIELENAKKHITQIKQTPLYSYLNEKFKN